MSESELTSSRSYSRTRGALFGGMVPEAWGGAGMDHVTFSACIEEISTSMAKMYASDVFQRVATEVQIHGAYGVSDEFPVARAYRDSKVFQIVEGTNEIHRMVIARELTQLKPNGARP